MYLDMGNRLPWQKTPPPEESEKQTLPQGHPGVETDDYSFETEITAITRCTKNPGHADFIPLSQFNQDNLPEDLRGQQKIVNYVRAHADATVHISVGTVSVNRPKFEGGGGGGGAGGGGSRPRRYPFYIPGGGALPRKGSGWVVDVARRGIGNEDSWSRVTSFYTPDWDDIKLYVCRCPLCNTSSTPNKSWYEIYIVTAKHVVFDESEAADAKVTFFFDDVNDEPIILQGAQKRSEIEEFSSEITEEDRFEFVCYTHDKAIGNRLLAVMAKCRQLEFQMYDSESSTSAEDDGKSERQREGDRLQSDLPVFVVSHPHGVQKYVTVGQVVTAGSGWDEHGEDIPPDTLTYTASTCPGSSGGWVWWAGRKGLWYLTYPHSAGITGGTSKSGGWR